MVQVLAPTGREQEATARFEKLLALRNDVGLLSDEYNPTTRRFLGNIPQAFSHTALINSALELGGVPRLSRSHHHQEGLNEVRPRVLIDAAATAPG